MEKVEIPQELIERLKRFGPLFLKVAPPIPDDRKSGKKAVELGWQHHPYSADAPERYEKRAGCRDGIDGEAYYISSQQYALEVIY